MTLSISLTVLEELGFKPLPEGVVLAGRFFTICVYQVHGFSVLEKALDPLEGIVAGNPYAVVVGSSVNAACRRLLGDEFVEDEEGWSKTRKCAPPYLVVRLGPTRVHETLKAYFKEDGSGLTTFDAFSAARSETRTWEDDVLPPLLASLLCAFAQNAHPVRFTHVQRVFCGKSLDDRTLHDVRIEASGSVCISSQLDADHVRGRLLAVDAFVGKMDPKVARFFHLGMFEADAMKRFLYFFLAIEVLTHTTYKQLTRQGDRGVSLTKLTERFMFCTKAQWPHVTGSDVDEFSRLKSVRDRIAHGEVHVPAGDSIVAVERLATKLHLRPK